MLVNNMTTVCFLLAHKRASDLTQRLQQAEDTIKLAAGALKNEKKTHIQVCHYIFTVSFLSLKFCVLNDL